MRELERESPGDAGLRAGDLSLVLIGAGRAGNALAAAADDAGLSSRLAGRDAAGEAWRQGDAVLLCVPDAAIAEVVAAHASAATPSFVGHLSGATGLDVLEPARERGARTFSIHPLQTLLGANASLAEAPAAIAGSDERAEAFARELAELLRMRPFAVPEESRAAYHAAASIASNFLVALEEVAAELAARAGVEDAREVLAPLVLRSAANWAEQGPDALTGPIARGDEDTVARHRDAIRDLAPELLGVYDALAERTRVVAAQGAGTVA